MSDMQVLAPEDDGGDLERVEVGEAAMVARERYEIEGRMILAKKWPRDELRAHEKMIAVCKRPSFANKAVYSYRRGGSLIQGPSVNLSRQAIRCWGNAVAGYRVLSMDETWMHLQGMAMDLETNATQIEEHKFKKMIQRKQRGSDKAIWVKVDDERELRELKGRHGAILERNCSLRIVPPYAVEDMVQQALETVRAAAAGDLKMSREDTIRALLHAYQDLYVTRDMIEAFLGHDLQEVDGEELGTLRTMYASIRDGNSSKDDFFERQTTKEESVISEDDFKPKPEPDDAARKREEKERAAKAEKKAASRKKKADAEAMPKEEPSDELGF